MSYFAKFVAKFCVFSQKGIKGKNARKKLRNFAETIFAKNNFVKKNSAKTQKMPKVSRKNRYMPF